MFKLPDNIAKDHCFVITHADNKDDIYLTCPKCGLNINVVNRSTFKAVYFTSTIVHNIKEANTTQHELNFSSDILSCNDYLCKSIIT